jgi:hypothetical protein
MITLEQAKNLIHGTTIHNELKTQSGGKACQRWRVTGRPKVWKTRPNEVQVPIRHGLRSNDYLTEDSLSDIHLGKDCPRQGW